MTITAERLDGWYTKFSATTLTVKETAEFKEELRKHLDELLVRLPARVDVELSEAQKKAGDLLLYGMGVGAVINPAKAYHIPSDYPVQAGSLLEGVIIPADWLTRFAEALGLSGAQRTDFDKKVGTSSTYTLKADLIKSTQVLYALYSGLLEEKLGRAPGEDEKTQIKSRITEGLFSEDGTELCTPGFHDRVNALVQALQLPRTLKALLYDVRCSVLEVIARRDFTVTDVHDLNRFYKDAGEAGLGVLPPNTEDIYGGDAFDVAGMKEKFEAAYCADSLRGLLCEQVRATLVRLGYVGKKPAGEVYDAGDYGRFKEYLDSLFGMELAREKLYVMGDMSRIQDVNWAYITQLLEALAYKAGVLKSTSLVSQHDFGVVWDAPVVAGQHKLFVMLGDKTSLTGAVLKYAWGRLSPAAKKKVLLAEDEQHQNAMAIAIVDQPDLRADLHALMTGFTREDAAEFRQAVEKSLAVRLMQAIKHNSESVPTIVKSLSERLPLAQQRSIFSTPDKKGRVALQHAARHSLRAVKALLKAFASLSVHHQYELISYARLDGISALMLAAEYQSDAVKPLLAVISRLPEAQQFAILTQKNSLDNNPLMLAAIFQPTAVEPLLTVISKLAEAQQIAILTQQNTKGCNALMLAAIFQPTAVGPLLTVISKLPEAQQITMLTQHEANNGYNALMLAAAYQPAAVAPILELIGRLGATVQAEIFRQVTADGWNALMMVVLYQPVAVAPILELIGRLGATVQAEIFRQVSANGRNALMLAVRHQPDAVAPLLAVIKTLDVTVQAGIFRQVSANGWNVLMIAVCNQPDAVAPLLAVIKTLDVTVQAGIFKQVTVDGWNALMIAETEQLTAVQHLVPLLLSAIEPAELISMYRGTRGWFGAKIDTSACEAPPLHAPEAETGYWDTLFNSLKACLSTADIVKESKLRQLLPVPYARRLKKYMVMLAAKHLKEQVSAMREKPESIDGLPELWEYDQALLSLVVDRLPYALRGVSPFHLQGVLKGHNALGRALERAPSSVSFFGLSVRAQIIRRMATIRSAAARSSASATRIAAA